MSERSPFPDSLLNKNGLNRQAIFDVADLPAAIRSQLKAESGQLILIGHGGRLLWEKVQAACLKSSDPIDDFTIATIQRWFTDFLPGKRYQILYPGDQIIGLQALGKLAGWHQPSPFMVGIDSDWGSWMMPSFRSINAWPIASCRMQNAISPASPESVARWVASTNTVPSNYITPIRFRCATSRKIWR
jgi:hypothetical protein